MSDAVGAPVAVLTRMLLSAVTAVGAHGNQAFAWRRFDNGAVCLLDPGVVEPESAAPKGTVHAGPGRLTYVRRIDSSNRRLYERRRTRTILVKESSSKTLRYLRSFDHGRMGELVVLGVVDIAEAERLSRLRNRCLVGQQQANRRPQFAWELVIGPGEHKSLPIPNAQMPRMTSRYWSASGQKNAAGTANIRAALYGYV